MPARRCPHCGLVNPSRSMVCDCGYSFADGSPPRYEPSKLQLGGDDFASRLYGRVVMRAIWIAVLAGGIIAIRMCSE